MADMADFALDQVMDAEDDRLSYMLGEMTDGEAYERGLIDEMGGSNHPPMFGSTGTTTSKTCAHCGETGLHWKNTPTGYRLMDPTGILHECAEHPFAGTHRTGPGTPSARLSWLLGELEKRVGEVNKFSSSPPEVALLNRLDALLHDRGM